MVTKGISEEDILYNPYFKIIDPACGGGYFLIEAYDRIKEIISKNYEQIINNHPNIKDELAKGVHQFILKNNLWGVDIDKFAVYMTTLSLLIKEPSKTRIPNIFQGDILLETKTLDCKINSKFQLVIGNPPYIGHKKIDKEYRKKLQNKYQDVYSNKSDLSYCFIKKGYDLLENRGRLIYITSRYFQESQSAIGLRSFIKDKFNIETIVDFYGSKVFKGARISPTIISCKKEELKQQKIHIYRLKDGVKVNKDNLDINDKTFFNVFTLSQSSLANDGWVLLASEEKNLFNKINEKGQYKLIDICVCNQGIITGCDKAFIVDKKTIEKEQLEQEIIKPWIKNSNIHKYKKDSVSKYILYTDIIKDLSDYPKVISHISPYKERLSKRRECIKGVRKWYQLQWGRELKLFEKPKIIFPFKSKNNKFIIDYDKVLCSADVYILNVKEEYTNIISLEYLLAFLNSSLFEFYFKCVAKKVGEKLYEYYPNKLMNLKIRIGSDTSEIINRVKSINEYYKKLNNISCNREEILMKIKREITYINEYFYKLYDIRSEEIVTIENRIFNVKEIGDKEMNKD
ncbi:hypothetical protein L21TH_2168 [Caldisalinibacter kiritimatiensis]|uniref:site-specific DNA-methyltransferase (adenine-specific) n=2 Tax=Caldisalinibacter kiritimatiensis TaxID=1304284 RepID=R1CBU9_9FIRM|nr:hypothetical protein L21TH_2168 [Caldisalinibacter kiritimatiensis]